MQFRLASVSMARTLKVRLRNRQPLLRSVARGCWLGRRLSTVRRANGHAGGGWRAQPLHLDPSESRDVEMDIALPPEPGEYNIYVSVMREHVAWFYNEGWPFLLIDILVDDNGEPTVLNWRIADKRSVARRRLGRSLSARFQSASGIDPAQSQPDSHAGPPRRPEPLQRLVRRRLLGSAQPSAADADVFFRVRPGAAVALWQRPEPRRLRHLFPRRDAALARLQRSRGPRRRSSWWSTGASSRSWSSRSRPCR